MAFQYLGNPYKEQKSLSDYMAVNDARALQRAQGERSIEASDMAIDAAKQKAVKDKIGLILAQTTPENYAESKAAIEAEGFPIKLPDSFEASAPIRDAILTATGYKSKPSLAEQMMAPFSMMMGVQQPTQAPAPTQGAAPIAPQGSIQTNELPQMDTNGQPLPQLNDILKEPVVAGVPNPPAINPPEPTSVPVPQPLPTTTLQTPIPAPYQPKTVGAAYEADKAGAKASAENAAKATQPITPLEQAKLDIDKGKQAKKDTAAAQAASSAILGELNVAARALEDFNTKLNETPDLALGPVAGRITSAAGYSPVKKLESAQNALTLSVKALLKMPSANFSNIDLKFIKDINEAVTTGKDVGSDAVQRIGNLLSQGAKSEQEKLAYIKENGTIEGYAPQYYPPSLANTNGSSGGGVDPRIAKAKAAGYTDEEIQQYLGGRK